MHLTVSSDEVLWTEMFIQSAEAFCAWQKDSYRSIRDFFLCISSLLCARTPSLSYSVIQPWPVAMTPVWNVQSVSCQLRAEEKAHGLFSETDSHNYMAHRANKHTLDQTWMKWRIICCLDPLVFHFPCSEFFLRVWLPRDVACRLLIEFSVVACSNRPRAFYGQLPECSRITITLSLS